MSKFSYTYIPLSSFEIIHDKDLLAENFITFLPDSTTSLLIKKYKLHYQLTPNGLVVLYKKNEHFDPILEDTIIVIDGVDVIDKKVIGYEKNDDSSNWLPSPSDFKLTFYGVTNSIYKQETNWENLALNKYIKYDKNSQEGTEVEDNTIENMIKPDAVFELDITDTNVSGEIETKHEFKIINN